MATAARERVTVCSGGTEKRVRGMVHLGSANASGEVILGAEHLVLFAAPARR
jgi:hypothetical protein